MQGKPKVISLHTVSLAEGRPFSAPHSVCVAPAGAKGKRAMPVTTHQAMESNPLVFMEPAR